MLTLFTLTTEQIKSKSATIEELINQLAFGNNKAIAPLYDLIKTDVYAFALSKIGNKHDAEDIMQDTFVQIYKHAKQYTPKGKPMAWIITIELNLIRRFFQLSKRAAPFELLNQRASEENVEEKVINNTFLTQIMQTLSQEEREIISLHVVSNMKHREIAKVLEKPLATVLSKYNRAIKKLQEVAKER